MKRLQMGLGYTFSMPSYSYRPPAGTVFSRTPTPYRSVPEEEDPVQPGPMMRGFGYVGMGLEMLAPLTATAIAPTAPTGAISRVVVGDPGFTAAILSKQTTPYTPVATASVRAPAAGTTIRPGTSLPMIGAGLPGATAASLPGTSGGSGGSAPPAGGGAMDVGITPAQAEAICRANGGEPGWTAQGFVCGAKAAGAGTSNQTLMIGGGIAALAALMLLRKP